MKPAKSASSVQALATWQVVLITLLASSSLALLHGLLFSVELETRQPGRQLLPLLGYVYCNWLPLIIANCALAFAFGAWRDTLLLPRNLLVLLLLALLLILPVMEIVAVLVELQWANAPLSDFAKEFVQRGMFAWWTDAVTLLFVGAAQAAFAASQQQRARALAWHQAQNELLQLRLRLLQGQLKPHFLFNALNSISALVRTAERELACLAMYQLRQLLHYVVQASEHEYLSVADELQFVRHYLDLQLLRFGERLTLEWQIEDAAWAQLACPPLLFQALLENAIQHGVEIHHQRCVIRIELALVQGKLRFYVANPLLAGSVARPGHGMGLAAIRGRIAILYHDQAHLQTTDDGDNFSAILHIPALALPGTAIQ